MAESVLDYEKRPARYSNIDGIGEMFVGFVLLAITLLNYLDNVAAAGSIWHRKDVFTIATVLIAGVFFLGQKLMKQEITYRRTGYVKYRYSRVKAGASAAVGFVVAGMVITCMVAFLHPQQRDRYMILFASLLCAFLYAYYLIYLAKMHHVWRYLIAICMAAGPLAVYSAFPNVRDIRDLSAGVLGACFLASGVITFVFYIRSSTRPSEAEPTIGAQ